MTWPEACAENNERPHSGGGRCTAVATIRSLHTVLSTADCCRRPGSMESGTEEVLRKLEELHRHTAKTVAGQIDPHDIEACEALLESYFMQASFFQV